MSDSNKDRREGPFGPLTDEELDRLERANERDDLFGAGAVNTRRMIAEIRKSRAGMNAATPTKCLVCKRPVFSKLVEDVLFVGRCSHCAAQDEKDVARASYDEAMEASRARDERDW